MKKEDVKKKLGNTVDKVSEANKVVREKAQKAGKWMKEHPKTTKSGVAIVALGIAAGIGYLLGRKDNK